MKDVLTVTTENKSLLGNFVENNVVARRATKVKLLQAAEFMDSVPPESDDPATQFDRLQRLAMINMNHYSGAMANGKSALPAPPSEILGL